MHGLRSNFSVMVASSLVVMLGAWDSGPEAQEQAADKPAAAMDPTDLLHSPPFDRITLTDNTVWVVDPVSPRPLPAIDAAKQVEAKRRSRSKKPEIPAGGNIGGPGEASKVEVPGAEGDADTDASSSNEVKLHLLQGAAGEVVDFTVKRSAIRKIEYFEDILLQDTDRLILAREFARAFESCLRVQTRNPGWPGLGEHVNHVLYAEGSQALVEGDSDRGLRLLRELLERKPDYPKLLDKLGDAYAKRIERAIELGLYSRGRRILHELEQLTPGAAVVKAERALFIARAMERVKSTEGSSGPVRLDALVEALRIWPGLEGVEPLYVKAFAAEPTLEVAVNDVSLPLGPWVKSPADLRVSRLLYRPILTSDDDDSRKGKNPDQLAASIESSDLGRRLLIRIRAGFVWSDQSRPVSAIDVARDLVDRSDPHSPRYVARWDDIVDRVEMTDESRIELRLKHAPLKAGAWFLGPVGPAHAGIDGRMATSTQERPLVSDGPYVCALATADQIELRGAAHDPSAANNAPARVAPPIHRIREIKISRGKSAVAALKRGEVSLVAHVPSGEVAALAAFPEIKVGQYSQPVIHILALDGRNPALRNRALRRGLSYAVDRKGLLEDNLLKSPPTDKDTVADGPFLKGSYADAPGVKPLDFQPWLAKMLVAAARKELGGAPIALNLQYPAIPEAQAAVVKIAEAFRQAGLQIETVEVSESALEGQLRSGGRFDIAYRVVRSDEPIQDVGTILCPGYDAPPEADALASAASHEILRLLLQLERAPDWPTARGLVVQIDREARDELPVIPLWQVVDHYAWRDRLKGPADASNELYRGLETWEITPWVAKAPWDAH
jgi:peptide/nickel transport system substrate-binding protein